MFCNLIIVLGFLHFIMLKDKVESKRLRIKLKVATFMLS